MAIGLAMVSEVPLRYGIVAIILNLLMTFTNVGIQTNWKKNLKKSTNLHLSVRDLKSERSRQNL